MDDFGWKFWLSVIGVGVGIAIGGILLFTLIGFAWYAWGAFGALIFFAAVFLVFGFIWDRTHARTYDDAAA